MSSLILLERRIRSRRTALVDLLRLAGRLPTPANAWNNDPTWDNVTGGGGFDNRPGWDNWSNKR
ncbi:multiple cyclophane-containing RiPP AmcA [Actinokineospora globicatena]|uniref:multiple cyclophane-containing RiPP AmcA n=1 Tax=Actinokineospora globicatena TaxID=103729 RepID=UPI0024A553B3|nr:hypothetical protein Aglo01_49860 [Actinokineospora globicatena]GLW87333.1 hypothetical protein Aglo02_49720 [Actinokineospora globicatena]